MLDFYLFKCFKTYLPGADGLSALEEGNPLLQESQLKLRFLACSLDFETAVLMERHFCYTFVFWLYLFY